MGQIEAVLDTHPALFRSVDQEHAAQRPERLTAEVLRRLLVDYDHGFACVDQFARGDQTGEAAAHDQRICIHHDATGFEAAL